MFQQALVGGDECVQLLREPADVGAQARDLVVDVDGCAGDVHELARGGIESEHAQRAETLIADNDEVPRLHLRQVLAHLDETRVDGSDTRHLLAAQVVELDAALAA